VTWLIAELCWSLRAYRQRAGELSFACALLGIAEEVATGRAFNSIVDDFDLADFHAGREALAGENNHP
jgi:hypothetical protein